MRIYIWTGRVFAAESYHWAAAIDTVAWCASDEFSDRADRRKGLNACDRSVFQLSVAHECGTVHLGVCSGVFSILCRYMNLTSKRPLNSEYWSLFANLPTAKNIFSLTASMSDAPAGNMQRFISPMCPLYICSIGARSRVAVELQ